MFTKLNEYDIMYARDACEKFISKRIKNNEKECNKLHGEEYLRNVEENKVLYRIKRYLAEHELKHWYKDYKILWV